MRSIHYAAIFASLAVMIITQQAGLAAGYYTLQQLRPDGQAVLSPELTVQLADVVILDQTKAAAVMEIWKSYQLGFMQVDEDRYGIRVGYIGSDTGRLLQQDLIAAGAAMAYSPKRYERTQELLAIASEHWLIDQAHAGDYLNHYRIVTGVVASVTIKPKQAYINFGEDWKTDFTIYIPQETLKQMDADQLQALEGKRVRVRGNIRSYGGPRIVLYDPVLMEEDDVAKAQ